jgi:hypothetical protein
MKNSKPKPSKPRNPVVRGMLNTPKRNAGRHNLSQRKKEKDMDRMVGEMRAIDAVKLLINHRPWETEGDYFKFKTERGLTAEIKRHPTLLHLCGYVHIPASHPATQWDGGEVEKHLSVHGGITYKERKGGKLIVGFDCAHAEDFVPGVFASIMATKVADRERDPWPQVMPELYRDMEFVKAEIQKLDDQLELGLNDWVMATAKQALRDGVSMKEAFAKKEANNVRTA